MYLNLNSGYVSVYVQKLTKHISDLCTLCTSPCVQNTSKTCAINLGSGLRCLVYSTAGDIFTDACVP